MHRLKEEDIDLYEGLYEHQKLMLEDIEEFSKVPNAKCLLQDTPTSGGKTYIVPRIMELAKRSGSKLIYMCDTRAHIGAVMDELVTFCRKHQLDENRILLIPSVDDGYRRFFDEEYSDSDNRKKYIAKYPYKGSAGNKPLESDTVYQLLSFIDSVALLSDHGEDLDDLRENTKNAVSECRRYLTLMDADSCDKESKDFYSEKFSNQECIIRGFIKHALRSYMSAHKGCFSRDFFNAHPIIKELYPGTKFESCDCCVITFAKSDTSINFFWAIPSASFTNPGVASSGTGSDERQYIEQILHDCWIYIDEADLYVSTLLTKKIEATVKCTVDMYNLTISILKSINEKKRVDENGHIDFDIPNRFVADSNHEKLLEKFRNLDSILCAMSSKFNLNDNLSPFFERIDQTSGQLPQILTTNNNIRVYNLGNYVRKDLSKGKDLRVDIYLHADRQRQQFLISVEDEGMYELKLEDLCHDCNMVIQHSLGIIRDMSNAYYQKMGEAPTEPITQLYAQKAALDMFGFRSENSDPEHNFYINNFYPRRRTSVEADDFYGVGYEIVRLVDSERHPERTKLRLLKLSQLPDFIIANEVLNFNKVILSSATINMETFQSPHIKWIADRVAKKMSELMSTESAETIISPSEVMQIMPHQKEIASILCKKQEENFTNSEIIFKRLFPYRDKNEEFNLSKACERYFELTGTYLPESSITDLYQFSRLIHALETVRIVCEYSLPFGIHFESALPSDKKGSNFYSESQIRKAINEMYKNNTITVAPENISIRSANASDTSIIMEEMDAVGIAENRCMILFTSYNSNGAGSNIYYCLSQDIAAGIHRKYDIPYIYLGEITNLIPQIQEKDTLYDIDCKQMEATYYLLKDLEIVKMRGEAVNESKVYSLLGKIYGGQPVRKDPFATDQNSVYKASAAAQLYQAFSRTDRGQNKSSKTIICYNADLTAVNRLAIGHAQFANTSTGYLFNLFLDELDKPVEIHQSTIVDEYFAEGNRKNVTLISDLARKIYESKKDRRLVSSRIRNQYEKIRASAWSLGYEETPYTDVMFCIHDQCNMSTSLHTWIPQQPEAESQETNAQEADRLMQAIVRTSSFTYDTSGFYFSASIKDRVFPFIDQVSEFFGFEWKKTFKIILDHRDEISTYDFPFLPYAETYFVFLGLLYENVFLCLCQDGGSLNNQNIFVSNTLPATAFEDADFCIAGTKVFFDIKGYSSSSSPSSDEKLKEKIRRLGGEASAIAYVYLNTKPTTSDRPHKIELIREYSDLNNSVVYEIHGLYSENQLSDSSRKYEIHEQMATVRQLLVTLATKYK